MKPHSLPWTGKSLTDCRKVTEHQPSPSDWCIQVSLSPEEYFHFHPRAVVQLVGPLCWQYLSTSLCVLRTRDFFPSFNLLQQGEYRTERSHRGEWNSLAQCSCSHPQHPQFYSTYLLLRAGHFFRVLALLLGEVDNCACEVDQHRLYQLGGVHWAVNSNVVLGNVVN